jgi:hypothetical protein
MLKSFWHFGNFLMGPDNFGHLIKVEENFHLCPKHFFGPSRKILMPDKNLVILRSFIMLPFSFKQIAKVYFYFILFVTAHPSECSLT